MGGVFHGASENGQDGEAGDSDPEEGSKAGPVELVEEKKVVLAAHHQPALCEPNEDHPEDEAEEEGEEVAGADDDLAGLDDHAAVEAVVVILESVSHQDGSTVHWGQHAWTKYDKQMI